MTVLTIREQLELLALDQHMVKDGEYGCPGVTCPAVQKLVAFGEAAWRIGHGWQPIETAPRDGSILLAWLVVKMPGGELAGGPGTIRWTDHNKGGWVSFQTGLPALWQPIDPPEEAARG